MQSRHEVAESVPRIVPQLLCTLHIAHCTLHIIDMATTVLQAGKIQSCDGRVWPKLTHFTRPGTEDEIYRGCNASILRAISEAKCVIPPPHPPLPRREVALSWGQLEASCHIQQHVLLLFPLPAAGVRLTLTWVPLVGFPPKSPEPGRVVHFLILIWSWLSWHCLPESRLVGCSLLTWWATHCSAAQCSARGAKHSHCCLSCLTQSTFNQPNRLQLKINQQLSNNNSFKNPHLINLF